MNLYNKGDNYKLFKGSMLDMLQQIKENGIDSIVTDPPYELNFMNKGWDNSGIAFQKETWEKCFEILKPGGYLLAFGGTRTYHRIACAIEDAGFEIRDCIMWLYGSGFPKSMNIGKNYDKKMGNERKKVSETKIGKTSLGDSSGWDTSKNMKKIKQLGHVDITKGNSEWEGWGTCLKPAYEPIIVARKPFKGSLVDNIIENGVGGLNIDECRVGTEERKNPQAGYIRRGRTDEEVFFGTDKNKPKENIIVNGRFPANVILTYDETDFDEVCGSMPNTKGGNRENTIATRKSDKTSFGYEINTRNEFNDSASRYFYCAKASKKDRDEGLDEFEEKQTTDGNIRSNSETARKYGANSALRKNIHPTVKPTELMQYLVRLVSPKGATILDPFMGSGSTGKAVMYENKERNANYKFIGIELTDEYLPIAEARIKYVNSLQKCEDKQMDIFAFEKE